MLSINHRFLLAITILMISISLIKAASLDGTCQLPSECSGTGLICRNSRCQCDAPWYTPCTGSCDIQYRFVYENEPCRLDANCIDNARCDNVTRQCVCKQNFYGYNGLCYKRNNESCTINDECWSQYCDSAVRRCVCRVGFEPTLDGRCTRRLARLYTSWAQANESNRDFCYDDFSCLAIAAKCRGDTNHLEKFCQCPPFGYTTDIANQRCDATDTDRLSPMNEPTVDDNTTCVFCKDNNAVCVSAARKTTCWCRDGHDKIGDQCENIRIKFIFPSVQDAQEHSYTTNCTNNSTVTSYRDNLCTCAPYQEYDYGTRRCKDIERTWISEYFEYGVCTRITSADLAQASNNDLCPPPLQCLENGDKHVCSCGLNKFLEKYSNVQQCAYRLGKPTEDSTPCPSNAERNSNGTCQCKAGYKQADDDRRCELLLLTQGSSEACESTTPNGADDSCRQAFGGVARYCRPGTCRCLPDRSYPHPIGIFCYGLLDISQDRTYCPPYSQDFQATTCQCRSGYRKTSDNRTCVPKSALYESNEPATNQPDLQSSDCQIYTGLVAPLDNSAVIKACRCEQTAFRNPDRTACWPRLYTDLSRDPDECYVLNSRQDPTGRRRCVCSLGYRPTTPEKKNCERISARLEEQINVALSDVDRISNGDCQALFGQLSEESNGQCICRRNVSYANNEKTQCVAFLNTPTRLPTLGERSCPQYATISLDERDQCKCLPGFIAIQSNRICTTADIRLAGTKLQVSSTTCTNFTTEQCMVKYGSEAFCDNNECWCNRRTSFIVDDSRCEPFANYIFPGLHERHNVSCDTDEDCVRDGSDVGRVECIKRTGASDDYKVCVCKHGWFLNPSTQTCESRCPSNCNDQPNRQCNGYECVCQPGFIDSGNNTTCIPNLNRLELYMPCNSSFFSNEGSLFECSSCGRAQCHSSYKDIGFQCVRYNFDTDRCIGRDFCSSLTNFSECSMDNNKCQCSSGYYQDGAVCVIPANSRCTIDEQCGINALCLGRRCRCMQGKRTTTITDAYGRTIERCINGVDRIGFGLISLSILIFVHLFVI